MIPHVHCYPIGRDHAKEGLECWCQPKYFIPCDECEGDPNCWKCDVGKIWLDTATAIEQAGQGFGLVVVHTT